MFMFGHMCESHFVCVGARRGKRHLQDTRDDCTWYNDRQLIMAGSIWPGLLGETVVYLEISMRGDHNHSQQKLCLGEHKRPPNSRAEARATAYSTLVPLCPIPPSHQTLYVTQTFSCGSESVEWDGGWPCYVMTMPWKSPSNPTIGFYHPAAFTTVKWSGSP